MAQNDIQKEDWKEISLATRAQILLNYNNLDFFKGDFKPVDIYQKNNKKNLDWFYVESEHLLVKSAEKTKDGKYNFSFPIEKEQDMAKIDVKSVFGGVEKMNRIIFGCFDIENSKIYRLEKTFYDICKNIKNSRYTLTVDDLKSEKALGIKEEFFNSWKALSKAEKAAKNTKNKRLEGFKGMANFFNWYNSQEKKCCYCGIEEADLKKYFHSKNTQYEDARQRGKFLEVERIKTTNGENEYTKENCALACYICNNAKSDFLSAHDFKPIAEGINKFWNDYLKKLDPKKEVKFDSDSEIWKNNSGKEMN